MVGQRDVHRVDVRVGQERLVAPERPRDAVQPGIRRGSPGVATGDRHQLPALARPDGPHQPDGDAARSQDPSSDAPRGRHDLARPPRT